MDIVCSEGIRKALGGVGRDDQIVVARLWRGGLNRPLIDLIDSMDYV